MTNERLVGPDGQIPGFRAEIGSVAADENAFFGWFNGHGSFEESYYSGAWDFAWHIACPLARHWVVPPLAGGGTCALEIGCGGGRLLQHAARFFPRVIGVDIHDELDVVGSKLRELGVHNAELRQSDGRSLPCRDGEVDVVYSFIVFQHLATIDVLLAYLRDTYRVLKPGGVAVLYMGRWRMSARPTQSRVALGLDLLLERWRLPVGFIESDSAVNSTNLRVSRRYIRAQARGMGFVPLMTCVSRRQVPVGTRSFGGQHGFVLGKPR